MAGACKDRSRGQRSTKQLQGTARCALQAEKTEHRSNMVLLWRPLKNVVSLKSPTFQMKFLFKLELEVNIPTGGTPSSFEGIMEIHTKQSTQACHPPSDELRTFQRKKAAFLKSLQHFSLPCLSSSRSSHSDLHTRQSLNGGIPHRQALSFGITISARCQSIAMHSGTIFVQTSSAFTIGLILKSSAQSLRPSCHDPIPELQPLGGPSNSLFQFALILTPSLLLVPCQQLHRAHKKTQILQPCPSLDLGHLLKIISSLQLFWVVNPPALSSYSGFYHDFITKCQPYRQVQVHSLGVT